MGNFEIGFIIGFIAGFVTAGLSVIIAISNLKQ